MTYNPKIKNTSNTDMSIDANVDANNITMGDAEDNDWTDGIFAFSTETKVGTAIDKINELLKGLAPKVPSDLNNLSSTVGGADVKLAFDTSTDTDLTEFDKVLQKDPYIKMVGPNYSRLGAYSSVHATEIGPAISIVLNGDKDADVQGAVTNLRADSFRVVSGKQSTFKIFINDDNIPKYEAVVSNESAHTEVLNLADSSELELTEVSNGKFLSSDQVFDLFQHRTGILHIGSQHLVPGANFVKVEHQIEGEDTSVVTNYVDFVIDEETSNDSGVTTYTQGNEASYNITLQGSDFTTSDSTKIKYISGIPHYHSGEYGLEGTIGKFSTNLYSNKNNGGIKGVDNLSNANLQLNANFDDTHLDLTTKQYTFNVANSNILSVSFAANSRLVGRPDIDIILENAIDESNRGKFTYNSHDGILFDNYVASNNNLVEDFSGETKRMKADKTTSWDSNALLTDADLAVFQGSLVTHNSLNVLGLGAKHPVNVLGTTLPTFASTGTAGHYYRAFVNTAAAFSNCIITITGTGFTTSDNLGPDNFTVSMTGGDGTEYDATQLYDNQSKGKNTGIHPSSCNTTTFKTGFTLGTNGVPQNQNCVMHIEIDQGSAVTISNIQIEIA